MFSQRHVIRRRGLLLQRHEVAAYLGRRIIGHTRNAVLDPLDPGAGSAATAAACRAFSLIEKPFRVTVPSLTLTLSPQGAQGVLVIAATTPLQNLSSSCAKLWALTTRRAIAGRKSEIRDNANDLVAAQDGQASDVAELHDPRDHLNWGVLGNGYGLRRHDLTDLAAMFALEVEGDLVGAR